MTKKNKRNMFYYRVNLLYGLFFLILLSSVLIFSNYFLRRAEAIPFIKPLPSGVSGDIIDFYKIDFNSDNIDDIVTLNSYYDGYTTSTKVSVVLGNSDGTFQNPVNYNNFGLNPKGFVCSDLNNDQKPDVAIIDYAESAAEFDIYIALNNGNGILDPVTNYTFTGTGPTHIIADDFNNDSYNDLVVAASFDPINDLGIFINDGSGGFTLGNTLRTMFGSWAKIGTADLNNDGYQDIVTNMYYHINNQDNTFTESFFRLDDGNASEIWDFEISDFNNDNNVDIVFASLRTLNVNAPIYDGPGGAIVLLGSGDGTFYSEIKYPANVNPRSVELGDFNNDGITDYVVGSIDILSGTSEPINLNFYLGNGDGTFSCSQTLAGFTFPEKIFIADINSDNYDDVFYFDDATYIGSPLYVLFSNGDGTFTESASYNVGPVHKLYFADLNSDNNQDVITATTVLNFIFGQGDGLLGAYGNYATDGPEDLISADFNNDSYIDIVSVNFPTDEIAFFAGKGNGAFFNPKYFPVGNEPMSITAQDFNNDGNFDVAVTNSADDTISVLLGDGDGNFSVPEIVATGDKPIGIFSVDFNGDEILDFAAVNNISGTVSVYLGNGDGTFNYLNDMTVNIAPRSVVSEDFNGDDFFDLAVSNSGSNNVSVFLGNGDGSFGAKTDYSVGYGPYSIVSDDYNDDGLFDLVTVNYGDDYNRDSTISILFGAGDGTFGSATDYVVHSNSLIPRSYDIVSADINSDGLSDLAVTNSSAYDVSPFLNQGDGTFLEYTRLTPGALYSGMLFSATPKGIIAADFNNDGNNDYAVALYGQNNITIALDLGLVLSDMQTSAVFAGTSGFSMELIGSGFDPVVVGKFAGSERSTTYIDENILEINLLSSDLTNIGIFDINVYNPLYSANSTSLPLNVQGIFVEKNDVSLGYAPQYVITADFNVDNKQDLAVLDSINNQLKILNGNGYGGFTNINSYTTGTNPTKLVSADMNGDSKLDFVVANSGSNNLSIFSGAGSSNFSEVIGSPLATGNNPTALAAFDVNSDNKNDIIVANSGDNNIQIFLQQSDGSFNESESSPVSVGSQPVALKAQDVNNDTKLDLLVVNQSSNNLSLLLNNGNGGFNQTSQSPFNLGLLPKDLCAKDFDNDNKLDIAVVNSGSDNVSILKGDNTGNFTSLGTVSVGQNPIALNCVDYTKDSYNDLAVLNYDDNNISLLLGNGTGSFGLPVSYDTGADPVSMVTNLFNKDTNLDLLTVNATSNDYSVLLGRTLIPGGSKLFTFSRSYSQESYPNDFVIEDFNGDDKLDMAVVSLNAGKLSISFGSGSGTFSGKTDYYIADKIASISSGDLDNDGDIDLAMGVNTFYSSTLPNIFVVFNNGDGTFAAPLSFRSYGGVTSVTCGDYNNDGLTDFAATMTYMLGKVVLYLSNGDGTFTTIDVYPIRFFLGMAPYFVDSADLNNDGNLDLLVSARLAGYNMILWGNGSGGFTKSTLLNMKGEMVPEDLNGDDFLDLVMPTGILLNNQNNTFSTPYVIENFFSGFYSGTLLGPGVAVGDFNNDSVLDLATTGKDSRTRVGIVKIIMGLGNGRFDMQSQYVVGVTNPVRVDSVDLNGDQRDDLLVLDASSNAVSVLLATIPSSGLSYRPSTPLNLQCQSLDSANIRWSFEDKAWNETGFKLYGPEGIILNLIGETITNSGYLDEGGLSANSLAADRYVTAYNNIGESHASNKSSCYTLANSPKDPIITPITGGLNIAINRSDGNPDYTEYAIFEYYSNKYIQQDGDLSEEVVWAIYDDWGGSEGVDAVIGENYKIYILARNSAGIISGFRPQGLFLSCKAISATEINWDFQTPATWDKEGYDFYRAYDDSASNLIESISGTDFSYTYTENNLTPNSQYSGFFTTYKTIDGNKTESQASNTDKCFTLANEPLPIIIGEVTENSVQLILDNNDGNPPETLYSIYEAKSGMYVQLDGSLGPEPFWQTYEQWGGVDGIYVNVLGSQVTSQFRITLTNVDLSQYEFVAQVKNGDDIVTAEPTAVISASKGVAINLVVNSNTFLGKIASASNGFQKQSVALRLIQEFSIFLNILLLILIIFFGLNLYGAYKYLNISGKIKEKVKYLFLILKHQPAVLFSHLAGRDNNGTYKVSYHRHRELHLNSQKGLKRTVGVLVLKVVILVVLTISLAGLQYASIAQVNYAQDTEDIKVGDKLSYIIRYANTGNSIAKGIVIKDNLDPNLSFVAGSDKIIVNGAEILNSTDNSQKNENDPLIFTAGDLGINQNASITFDALVRDTGVDNEILNSAEIAGYNFNTKTTNIVSNKVITDQVLVEEKPVDESQEPPIEEAPVQQEAPAQPPTPVSGGASTNLLPLAVDDSAQTLINQPVEIAVLANDSDPENQLNPATFVIVIQPQKGTASIDPNNLSIIYTPNADYVGEDVINYRICDSVNQCAEARVLVTVNAVESGEVKVSLFRSFIGIMREDVSKTNVGEQALANIAKNETVKAIIESQPVQFAQDKVFNNPVVEQVSQDVVTPALVTVSVINTAPAIATAGLNFGGFLHFIFVEPLLILFRRKRKNWGVVYDSLTKMPISLALVRLYRKEDRRLVQTKVTDRDGRYLIMVKDPGVYYLEVTKLNYDYPTKILGTEKTDTKYLDLYHGEEMTIQDKEAAVSVNIPLDVRDKKVKPISLVIRSFALQNLKNVISYVGLILAVLVLIIYPSIITIAALLFHIIFYVTFRKLLVPAKPKGWGIVYDEQTKQNLNNVVVRLFDIKFNKLLETQLTDSRGRYAFLVGKNVYQILAEKDGYQSKEIKPVDLTTNEELVNLDIALAKPIEPVIINANNEQPNKNQSTV